ncbi:MAG: alcohol dehydrogenase catalytic domain-containing protein [Oscillospiraceae bacterium]|nr:alcohol dehydrogenase catalytic domain-containing protein [Oscillospiraceae bacterium]
MKASMYEGNQKIALHEIEPTEPGPHEVRLKIAYCGICGTDLHLFKGGLDYRIKNIPQAIGHECSATVDKVGSEVTDWKPGDRVVVRPLDYCNECVACKAGHSHVCANLKFMGIESPGAFQNFWTVHERTLHRIPDDLSLLHGALVEPLAVCCHAASRGEVKSGEYAVVIGGGTIGLMTALVLKYRGLKVVVSEINPNRLAKVPSMGIDTINPKETDVLEYVKNWTNGDLVDVVFECSGAQPALDTVPWLCHPRGRVVLEASYPHPMQYFFREHFMREVNIIFTRVYEAVDYEEALDMMSKNPFNCDDLISEIIPLGKVQEGIETCLDPAGKVVKIMVDCQSQE